MFGITIETDADKGNCQKLWLSKAESNFQSEAPLPPQIHHSSCGPLANNCFDIFGEK